MKLNPLIATALLTACGLAQANPTVSQPHGELQPPIGTFWICESYPDCYDTPMAPELPPESDGE